MCIRLIIVNELHHAIDIMAWENQVKAAEQWLKREIK